MFVKNANKIKLLMNRLHTTYKINDSHLNNDEKLPLLRTIQTNTDVINTTVRRASNHNCNCKQSYSYCKAAVHIHTLNILDIA